MEMKDYEALKRKLCKELEEVKDSKSFGMAEIEIIDKLLHSIKNIGKITEMDEGSSYARDDMSMRRSYGQDDRSYGRYSYNNHDGNYESNDSYAGRRGMHYVRGHYSHAGDEANMLMDKMQRMIDDSELTLDDKSALTRAIDGLRK